MADEPRKYTVQDVLDGPAMEFSFLHDLAVLYARRELTTEEFLAASVIGMAAGVAELRDRYQRLLEGQPPPVLRFKLPDRK